jgi:signal transduction histidine kinase
MPMPTFLAYVLPDDRPMLADRIADVARHGGRLRLTFRVLDGEGNERWLRLEGAALADTSGEPTRVLAVVADVTDRMRLEAQLQQAAKLDAVGSVAAGIAHDFGNMLMAIQASVELATSAAVDVSGPTAHHVRTDLQEALGALRHARMLTTQLMAYSRREPPRPRAVELGEAVRALEPLLRRLLGTRGKLELVLDEQPVMVMIDPSQLDQVLLNLVVNARDVTPDGGRIIIATGRETTGDRAWLAVQDSGPGIPEDVIPRIFDAFFTTKASGKGTGLGLATVHRIVTTAGGAVNAANDPTGGAIFTVYLPVAAGPALIAVA